MNDSIPLSAATLPVPTSISRSPLRRGFPVVLLALALAWFALLPTGRAVSPPPDGGYPNGNTAEGDSALFSLTSGSNNTANGSFALYYNTGGASNTAIGFESLAFNTTGNGNTAVGWATLLNTTTGSENTAIGILALYYNTTGDLNTATGPSALYYNTTGSENTATGFSTLYHNTTGNRNTATGRAALGNNTTGINNTATGTDAMSSSTTGINNTASGVDALFGNTSGQGNTATGFNALKSNTTAFNNTATGQNSLQNNTTGGFNTAEGFQALSQNTTGSLNIALGSNAGANLTTGSNNIDIGNRGVAGDVAKIRIGKVGTQTATFIAGINGVTVANGVGVVVSANGQLGTVQSSARYKDHIKPMDKASEAILALKPVSFRYKKELDPDGVPQFGLVAEQVEKVNPDLVVRGEDGKVMTVRYEAVNAMVLNEFLKEHRKVEEQDRRLQTQETAIAQQQKQIEALTASVQKVSDQVGLRKPAPQLVTNP